MGKLLRRNNKSPDAEQLLTPRKNGFFGKRNNGVRSEDFEKPKTTTARRMVTSVFHKGRRDDEDESHPLDDSPAIQLKSGTPKTAPPSPDLDMLARGNHHLDHHHHHHHHHNSNNSHRMEEETVISDLTGTVGPTAGGSTNHMPIALASEEKASGITPPVGGQSVTFAEGAPPNKSFYSAYSPGLKGFRTESGNVVNIGSDHGSYTTGPRPLNPTDNQPEQAKSMLDQVLQVMDGACQRSIGMDLTGSHFRRTNGITREWGRAPSADDDDSRSGTSTRDTSTFNPRTRDCNTTSPGTMCTGGSSYYATNTVATPHTAPILHEDKPQPLPYSSLKPLPYSTPRIDGASSVDELPAKTPPSKPKLVEAEQELHENFELVTNKQKKKKKKRKKRFTKREPRRRRCRHPRPRSPNQFNFLHRHGQR
jgi:hypothetical protein